MHSGDREFSKRVSSQCGVSMKLDMEGMEQAFSSIWFIIRLALSFRPNSAIELQFKDELRKRYNLVFDSLFVITNMPINRFRHFLERADLYETYMQKLINAFNPTAAEGVMCRTLISVGYDGILYDCDFNQMLEMGVSDGLPSTIWDFDFKQLATRDIVFGSHCFGCTAGAGSSCGGTTVK